MYVRFEAVVFERSTEGGFTYILAKLRAATALLK